MHRDAVERRIGRCRVTDTYDLAAELFEALAHQERRTLSFLLTHRKFAEQFVRAGGLKMEHFEQDDHRLIFAAWEVACEEDLPLPCLLKLARWALQAEHFWDEKAIRTETGMRHSNATLAAMATVSPTKEEYRDAMAAVGENGDWLAYIIARNIAGQVSSWERLGVSA